MKKIYLDTIEEKSSEISKYSKNDIALIIEELKEIPKQFIWQGAAYTSYINGYNEIIKKLEELNSNIGRVGDYLYQVADDYTEANTKINETHEELIKKHYAKTHNMSINQLKKIDDVSVKEENIKKINNSSINVERS